MNSCLHCEGPYHTPYFDDEDTQKIRAFCCYGCLTVYNLIQHNGLKTYYDIKKNTEIFKKRSPVELRPSRFLYLDDPTFLIENTYVNSSQERVMDFFLEGIQCLACLWLIEKLPVILPTVQSSRLDLEKSVATITLCENGKFSEVARELSNLGYRPHPLKMNGDALRHRQKEERANLFRIGLAGASAGNIMLYAVSLYGGAGNEYASLFNNITVFLALPVLTYCSYPFYKNAWSAFRNHTISIDIPISLALILGGIMGLYNLIHRIHENYFDSLTTLVFLLLLSRYFLQKIQHKGLSDQNLHYFYLSESVLKEEKGQPGLFIEVPSKNIQLNDILKVLPGEFVPADGILLSEPTYVNNSLLTGESTPQKIQTGQKVLSGTQSHQQDMIIQVHNIQRETRLGSILHNIEITRSQKSQIVDLTSKFSKYFSSTVFLLAVVLFLVLLTKGDPGYALERAITLLIVTCPCAVALATPLAFTKAINLASQHGIIIKDNEAIENLSQVKNIFLDKTGTLTHGKIQVSQFHNLKSSQLPISEIIQNLEKNSKHPVALALLEYVKGSPQRPYVVQEHKEVLGHGVSGFIEDRFYEINRDGIFEDSQKVATFTLQDLLRSDSKKALQSLLGLNLDVKIVSGDRPFIVGQMAQELGLTEKSALADLTPEMKGEIIRGTPKALMVGDGANDALALSEASVGVAVSGGVDVALRAADVYLTTPGLEPLEKLVTLSRETIKVIRRNLLLSLAYNSFSVFAAFAGFINPLMAAIIMPCSSLTVLVSTVIGTKRLRNLWKS